MSVKIRAKNASSALQTLACDNNGSLNILIKDIQSGISNSIPVSDSVTQGKLDTIETSANAIQSAVEGTLAVADATARISLATIAGDTTSLDAKLPAVGQNAKSASVSVTLASDQGSLAVADSASAGHLANIVTATQLIDDIVITDNTAYSSASTKGVMLLAKDSSGNMKPVELNASSELKVTTASGSDTYEVHTSSHTSVSAGASVTSSTETLTKRNTQVGFFIKSTDSNPPSQVEIEVSADNSNFAPLSSGGGFNFTSDGAGSQVSALNAEIPYPFVRVKMTAGSGGTHNVTIQITH